MRFWGCDTSVSSGSWGGCSVMVLVVWDAAEERQGRRQPEPERLYAAVQANVEGWGRTVRRGEGSVHMGGATRAGVVVVGGGGGGGSGW